MKALIVDDEKHVLEGLKNMIPWQDMGVIELDFADNGAMGWSKFSQNQPDLILTDMNMKEMNGIELIRKIREVNADIPILVLSGYDDFVYTKTAIQLNVTRYILKPSIAEEIEREIRDVINELQQKRREKSIFIDIQKQFEQSIPILREQLLNQIVTTGSQRQEVSSCKLDFFQLDPSIFEGGLLMSIKIYKNDRKEIHEERQWQLYKFAVSNIVEELLTRHGNGYLLRYIDNRLPILLTGDTLDALADQARQLGRYIIDAVQSYLRVDLNIGIGRGYKEVFRYVLSLNESAEILEIGEMEGMNQIYSFTDLTPEFPQWVRYPVEQIQLLSEAIIDMDRTEATSLWLEIRRTFVEVNNVSLAYLHTVCTGIITNLSLKLMEHDSAVINAQYTSDMLQKIHQYRTLEGLMDYMSERIDELYTMLAERNDDQRGLSYVEFVKKAVTEQYSKKISFAELAKELNINRNYLSNLFKKEMGVSFVSFLGNYRISKAKALLMKKRYTVYEIAEMVGYQEPAYFSRMFKNITGVSPLEYVLSQAK